MKMNMTREKVTIRSGTSIISDESGSGRGSCTEEESGDDIDDANQQHVVSNPLFDKSSYSSLDDVMESSSSSTNDELRTVHQQAMNMIDMDYSFNPLDIDDTITTNDHRQQDKKQQQEEEHICRSILPHSCTDPKVCFNFAAQNHTWLFVCTSSITYLMLFFFRSLRAHTQSRLTRTAPFSPVLYVLHVAIGTLVNSVHGTLRVSLVIYPRTIQCYKSQKEQSR